MRYRRLADVSGVVDDPNPPEVEAPPRLVATTRVASTGVRTKYLHGEGAELHETGHICPLEGMCHE